MTGVSAQRLTARRRFITAATVTVLTLGGLEAGVVALAIERKVQFVKAGWRTVPVLKFTHDLAGGAPLGAGDVEAGEMPEQLVPEGSPGPAEAAKVVGHLLHWKVSKGDVVTRRVMTPFFRPGEACVAALEQEATALSQRDEPSVQALLAAMKAQNEVAR